MSYRVAYLHEAKIQDGGKTVHVVFKYVSRRLLYEGARAVENLPPSTSPYFIKDDVTVIRLLGVSFMVISLPVCVCVYTAVQPQVQTNHKTWSLYVSPVSPDCVTHLPQPCE